MSTTRTVDTAEEEQGADPGDAACAERLFREHGEWLRRRLTRHLGADLAEDIVQETWTRLIRRGRLSDVEQRPKPFLIRVAANLLKDRSRRASVRPTLVTMEGLEAQPATPASQTQTLLLKQVVMALPSHLRIVFVLSRFRGWTYQSIADHLNISVKTVEWRMSKALDHCTERLRD